MSAAITVTRPAAAMGRDRLHAYTIVVDGDAKGSVREGETKSIEVEPGRHRVRMKIDWWCRSRDVQLDLRDRDEAILVCRPNGWVGLMLLPINVWRKRYLELQLVQVERTG